MVLRSSAADASWTMGYLRGGIRVRRRARQRGLTQEKNDCFNLSPEMKHICSIRPWVAVVLWWAGSICGAHADTPASASSASREALKTGDLNPIHTAYEHGNLDALWSFYLDAYDGLYGAMEPGKPFGPNPTWELNRLIEVYAARLLAQHPGHARHMGDRIDKLVNKIDFRDKERNSATSELARCFEALRALATPECIQQTCRFLEDQRDLLSDEEARALFDRPMFANAAVKEAYMPPRPRATGDGPLSGVAMAAAANMALLAGESVFSPFPFPEAIREKDSRLDLVRHIRRWWRSDAAKQIRQLRADGQPPVEQLPAKIDVKTLPAVERKFNATQRFEFEDPMDLERRSTLNGNLEAIHTAYERRDLDTLWRVFCFEMAPSMGAGMGPKTKEYNPSLTMAQWQALSLRVGPYVSRLLSQIPGHARFLGDRIEALSATSDLQRSALAAEARGIYFHLLSQLGSPECVRELGRFMNDGRGEKPVQDPADLQIDEELARRGVWPSDKYPVPNGWHAARGVELALGDAFPLVNARTDRDQAQQCMSWRPDGRKAVEDWWTSDAARKYREPPPLPEPPKEPRPERIDMARLQEPK